MVNLNNFLNIMAKNLELNPQDIISTDHIKNLDEIDKYIDKLDETIKSELNIIFNDLLKYDNDINIILKKLNADKDNIKQFNIAIAKSQLLKFLNKYKTILIELKLIGTINDKLDIVIDTLVTNLTKNKYYIYYKYLKYKNKYLQLKYNNI